MDQFPRINRLPPYVFSLLEQLKRQRLAEGADIFDFGLGNPDQPPPPHVIEALQAALLRPNAHRYAPSQGIPELRKSISHWYGTRFNIDLDPETETIVTIGSKEGLAHLALAAVDADDTVLVPNPCYPVHHFGFTIADANVRYVPLLPEVDFIASLENTIKESWPKPKMIVINFPANPTAQCVDRDFFAKIIEIAKEHNIWVVHDLAYADLVYDGYRAPSILEVPGAKDIAVETYTLSKSYNMAGWRVGFMCGNAQLLEALARIKAYIDYGSFIPIQYAAIAALEGPQDCVKETCNRYQKRRDILCAGLKAAGWDVQIPKATLFVWAKIPERYRHLGSLDFAKMLIHQANVVVSPGIGFGEYGNEYVRISLVEDEARMQRALQNIMQFMRGELDSSTEMIPSEMPA